jgi:hypothetical protein
MLELTARRETPLSSWSRILRAQPAASAKRQLRGLRRGLHSLALLLFLPRFVRSRPELRDLVLHLLSRHPGTSLSIQMQLSWLCSAINAAPWRF